jgi:hypothetical protein
VCRALKVLCVAQDTEALGVLKRATVSAEWELAPGATDEDEAIRQLHAERPHVVVVFGLFPRLVERVLETYPSVRVISDHAMSWAVVVGSSEEIRDAVKHPDGPVRS